MPALTAELAAALQKRAIPRTHAHAVRFATCFLLAMLGALIGGYAGWLYDAGFYVIAGATAGFLFFGSASFCIAGHLCSLEDLKAMAVDTERTAMLGLSNFDLYITVHRVKNLYQSGPLMGIMGRVYNSWVELKVGKLDHDGSMTAQKNPEKRTCVNPAGLFEECFHFIVSPSDDTIRLLLYSQELFNDEVVGICDINITEQVLQQDFPQRQTFNLLRTHNMIGEDSVDDRDTRQLAGSIVVSFTPGANFPQPNLAVLQSRSRLGYHQRREAQEHLLSQTLRDGTRYGTWATSLPA